MSYLLLNSNALAIPLASNSVHCVVTSPPYFQVRDYDTPGQLGLEDDLDCAGWATGSPCRRCYMCQMVAVFEEVKRVLRKDGTLWVNMGDSYTGGGRGGNPPDSPHQKQASNMGSALVRRRDKANGKQLRGTPWRLALALQANGWILRNELIWEKPNCMPESVTDRFTRSHEHVFLFSKSRSYFFDLERIKEPSSLNTHGRGSKLSPPKEGRGDGHKNWVKSTPHILPYRNPRTVWRIRKGQYKGEHFATFPVSLPEKCIKAGTSLAGVCSVCGASLKRDLQKVGSQVTSGSAETRTYHEKANGKHGATSAFSTGAVAVKQTMGWLPTCKCFPGLHTPTGRPVVLDPFSGSSTTGAAALALGCDYIGLDLNFDYLKNEAKRRLASVQISLLF